MKKGALLAAHDAFQLLDRSFCSCIYFLRGQDGGDELKLPLVAFCGCLLKKGLIYQSINLSFVETQESLPDSPP